jgi:hypothetical protein
MFVSDKELLVPVAAQAFSERTGGPVQAHCVLIIVQKWGSRAAELRTAR